jgi:DNA-binding beta-propeller fold protein YncE
VVETGTGIVSLDLTDGARKPIATPAGSTDAPYLGRIAPLTDGTYLRVVGAVRSDGTLDQRIVRVDAQRASRLAVTVPTGAGITAVCPSPNGQFAAVVTRSATSDLVSIIDATSGALEASVEASTVDWCGALPSGDEVG